MAACASEFRFRGVWILRTTRHWLPRDLDVLKPIFERMRVQGFDLLERNAVQVAVQFLLGCGRFQFRKALQVLDALFYKSPYFADLGLD
jgi:hypothetical protein